MKKLTSIFLSVIIILNIFCGLGITVSADNTNVEVNSEGDTSSYVLKYNELSDGTLEVCGFENNTSEVDLIIPSEYNGKHITKIADSAFKSNWNITSLTVSETVDSIGAYAFENCRNLNRVVMGKGITNIGLWAFKDCTGLKRVYISDLKSWNNIKFFDAEANPLYCADLYLNEMLVTNLIIPNDVTSINCSAFQKCTSITSVTIPNGVKSIGSHAFSECKNLTDVAIGKSVTSIGDAAFWGCSNLKNIYYSGDKSDWKKIQIGEINYNLTEASIHYNSYDGGTTGDYTWIITEPTAEPTEPTAEPTEPIAEPTEPTAEPTEPTAEPTEPIAETSGNLEYIIFGNTATITKYKGSSTWPTLAIPASIDGYTVTGIGDYAFMGCKGITSIFIPDSITSIGKGAFSSCENIRSITIPDSVTSIGDYAFYNCISLTNITIPASVTSIGGRAFGQCKALVNIEVDINSLNYTSKDGNLYDKETTKLILYALGKNVYSFTFPQNVTSIGSYAFEGCTILTNISIPDSVTSIDDCAFYRCASLKSITIPDSVTSIGSSAFCECKKLESITIPNSVTSIGDGTFYACYSLTNITIPNSVTSIGKSAFSSCSSLKRVLISNSVTSIGRSAFSSCSSLTSIAIPDSVTSIGDDAFYGCTKLYGAFVPIDLIDLNTNNIFPSTTKIYYIEKEFSINYDANGGIGAPEHLHFTSDTKTISFTVTKQIPSRTGYIFEGWSNEPNGSADYLPGNKYTISKSITLYAVWRERNTYTIKYKLCGGKGDIQNQIKTEGIDLKLSSIIPTHPNYTFAYWISSDKQTTYSAGSSYKADANDTLYAVWKEVCSKCEGSPYSSVRCDKCNGSKYSSIKTCAICNGNGKLTYSVTCNSCNGTGAKTNKSTETCPLCNGQGYRYKNGNFEVCYLCSGMGEVTRSVQVTCKTCGGDGECLSEKSCTLCKGSGTIKTKCDKCGGNGSINIICDKCNGKNSIIYHYPNYETELNHDEDNPQLILGDANGDGTIDINDATCIQKHLAEYKNDDYIEEASDADGDGRVTIGDVTVIQQYLAEMLCPDGIGKPTG